MKKTALILSFLLCIMPVSVYSSNVPSKWAEEYIENSEKYGFISENVSVNNYAAPINRLELCGIILRIYNLTSECEYNSKGSSYFSDTEDKSVDALYELGIVSGLGDGKFEPYRSVTRQEIAKFFSEVYIASSGENIEADESNIKKFTDFNDIGKWAYPYISFLLSANILNGYEDGSFKPQSEVTVEQALVLAVRMTESMLEDKKQPLDDSKNLFINDVKIKSKEENGINISADGNKAVISFPKGKCEITVTQQRDSYYENSIEAKPYINDTVSTGEYSFEINPTRIYKISVSGDGIKGYAEFITERPDSGKNQIEIDSFGAIMTEEEASALQKKIEIPVWRISNGERVAGTADITVHTAIADRVKMIFEEIYNGKEKFPVMDIGGYSWRAPMGSGRLSEHNLGTAIDINADQNYCVYSNGNTVGSYWKPYEDPYSITPYGEVINIFEKYGFTWGGDAWRSPNDYMHFSYLGT